MRGTLFCLTALTFGVVGGLAGVDRTNESVKLVEENFFVQPVDNFNSSDTRTWKMRYLIRDDFFSNNGPIFIMLGGQAKISDELLIGGYMNTIGSITHAYLIQTEHRYYGDSQVTSTTSTENLKYLNVEQAMADVTNLVKSFKQQPKFKDSKVIVFGGSYAGNMATWMRLKYPDIIDGAIASSAPVLAKVDFSESFEVIKANLINEGGETCAKVVDDAINETSQWITSDLGAMMLSEKFSLCQQTDPLNPLDVQSFFSIITQFMSNFMMFANKETMSLMCGVLSGGGDGTAMDRLANVFKLFTGIDCNVADYKTIMAEFSNVQVSSPTAQKRLQLYQACTQFGQFQTTTSKNQPFGETVPLSYYLLHLCPDAFGSAFGTESAEAGASKTNLEYGGLTPNVTKLVSIHGSMDPWHKLGITTSLSDSSPAFLAKGEFHAADMEDQTPSDSSALNEARALVTRKVIEWVSETY